MSNKSDAVRAAKLKDKNDRGEFELVDPLDYLILRALPDEGELVMNYYPLTKSAKQLITEDLPGMKSSEMVGPLRRLSLQKLIVRAGGRNIRTHAYQRTKLGKQVYQKWAKDKPSAGPGQTSGAESK